MKNKTTEIIDAEFETISTTSSNLCASILDAAGTAYEATKTFGSDAGNFITTTAELIGDLNGDGKVDIEDAKIALEKANKLLHQLLTKLRYLAKK